MHADIRAYHAELSAGERKLCNLLVREIEEALPDAEGKVWHAHPVWFLDGNPIVGYSKLKGGMRLMFWSGKSFEEPDLVPGAKFKDASISYTDVKQVDTAALARWLAKSRDIQWDYKNIVKRKGKLVRVR